MKRDWVRLGAAVREARRAMRPRLTQPELGRLAGVSRATIQAIEAGNEFEKITPTLRAIERVLGWGDGSVESVLAGGHPTAPGEQAPHPPVRTSLPQRIQHELDRADDLVDTVVIPLGDGASAVVVVKNPDDATPEQRQRNLEAWLRMQSQLAQLDYTDESGTGRSPGDGGG